MKYNNLTSDKDKYIMDWNKFKNLYHENTKTRV